jgi:hypothetical protein
MFGHRESPLTDIFHYAPSGKAVNKSSQFSITDIAQKSPLSVPQGNSEIRACLLESCKAAFAYAEAKNGSSRLRVSFDPALP